MKSLVTAVKSGNYRQSLESLRDVLAAEIEAGEGNVAALAKQLTEVLARLDSIRAPEVSKSDDLAKRRASRRAQVQKRASGAVDGSGGSG